MNILYEWYTLIVNIINTLFGFILLAEIVCDVNFEKINILQIY